MLQEHALEGQSFSRRDYATVFVLLFNTLTWLYITIITLDGIISNFDFPLTIWIFYYLSIVASGFLGSSLSSRIKRHDFLLFWITLGTAISLLLALPVTMTLDYITVISVLLGIGFGLGIPSCFAYFADNTLIENRGRLGGFIFLFTNLSAALLVIPFATFNYVVNSILLALWRAAGLIFFLLLAYGKEIKQKTRRQASLISIFHDRSFVLYLIPWIMFSFTDRFGGELLGRELAEAIIGSFSAVAGGFLSDKVGRKRVVVYSFVMLGIAYGIMGIAPTVFITKYLYMILDGTAGGMLFVTFVLILWGDLSQAGLREKYYVIGCSPLFLTYLIPLFLHPYIAIFPVAATFSLASFFLFLAVLPLMYAPETLPEKKMEIRRLKGYIEQAKKFTEKYTKKNGNKS